MTDTNGWGAPCQDAGRTTIKLFGSNEVWDKQGVFAIKYAELLAGKTKYGQFLARVGGNNAASVQTYACRPITGTTNTYSLHSWPRAVDIRPPQNSFSYTGRLTTDFDKFSRRDAYRFVHAFLSAGFRWGATWSHGMAEAKSAIRRNHQDISTGRVDAMHFELDTAPQAHYAYWTKKLRKYGRKHPVYFRKVKKHAKAKTAHELLKKWQRGDA